MFHFEYLLYIFIIHSIFAIPQINLYYTDEVSESHHALQHNCLHALTPERQQEWGSRMIPYCMSELPSKFKIEEDDLFSKFTFAQLSKENITSYELYLWSAPIDLIERYQFYLYQSTTTNTDVFYNCTMPRFGPQCQYELYYHYSHHSSLQKIVEDFYNSDKYDPTVSTCYTLIKCNHGPSSICLDWREICDDQINCLDDGIDEEYCWELEVNQCEDNEYRCRNGQCIPKSFYNENHIYADCIDLSDLIFTYASGFIPCYRFDGPSVMCENLLYQDPILANGFKSKPLDMLLLFMYMEKDSLIHEDCWSALECLFGLTNSKNLSCETFCQDIICVNIIQNRCPSMLYFPNFPVLFTNIYFAYRKIDFQNWTNLSMLSFYICYNTTQYDDVFMNMPKIEFNNVPCIHAKQILDEWIFSYFPVNELHSSSIYKLYGQLKSYHLPFNYNSTICNRSNMYSCIRSSKCISIDRLIDTINDCPHQDDENITLINTTNIIKHLDKTRFKCRTSNKYIHQRLVKDDMCDCGYDYIDDVWCEDEDGYITYLKRNIIFQHICDGFIDLFPLNTTGRIETDETECQQWECNNIYTRCNKIWNCPNGADEAGCNTSQLLNCSSNHHLCVLPNTNELICLSIIKINDGNIDCLGGTDEPQLCGPRIQSKPPMSNILNSYYCMNYSPYLCISQSALCNGNNDCEHGDDEQFCTSNQTSNVEKFLYNYRLPTRDWNIIDFIFNKKIESVQNSMKTIENSLTSSLSVIETLDQFQSRCHRGLNLRIWLNNKNNLTTDTCLCPPSYYGNQCEYQNQRINLNIQFQASSASWQTLFAIVISLIDDSDQRIIHSYEQITYLSIKHCNLKFNQYLLYSTRPKDPKKQYAIHIDFYEKISLIYRGSVLLNITFPFLPVHYLAFIVHIPRPDDNNLRSCSNDKCKHGKCIKYVNHPQNLTFCQCDQGWSGKYCTIQYNCTCSSDSLCIGIAANNRSICICPQNKFGPRCLLTNTISPSDINSSCQNGSVVTWNDDYMIFKQEFACICSKGFRGDYCNISDNQLILSFGKDITLTQSIFIHFIQVVKWYELETFTIRATTFRTIPVKEDSVTVYWSEPFHLVFTELLNKNYYLTIVQKDYHESAKINKTIISLDRCPNISELFNQTFLQWNLIRRIKYYHLPCLNQSLNLSCFYDDVHLCLCYQFGQKRLANCFKFDHNQIFDCLGQNECENGAQCLQDKPKCSTKSLCICPSCYYGHRCQFSTSGFGLSLDAILGYHILPNLSVHQQPFIIKMSITLTIIFIVTGVINGVLTLITFKKKIVREVGCGIYLLGSSITTLLIIIIFGLKFFILLFTQMAMISNRSFLKIQCHSLDFLLRICLSMDQWLNACVAAERAFTAIKGARFSKRKSKQAAKFVIGILSIVIVGTYVHDPIYRRLIDEENYTDDIKRTWCVTSYSFILKVYNSIIHIFHFFGPFIVNLISTIILIRQKSRQQFDLHTHRNYREILRKQFLEHKHLLIAPIVLIILELPRLIIIFLSKCMKSANDAWLFLIAYFISLIPPLITFIIFISPSKFYKKEFQKSIVQYRNNIRRHLHLTTRT